MVIKMDNKLRIGMITGVLGKGGAEKQLYYIARSLKKSSVEVKVFSLTKDEYYERKIKNLGIEVIWVGKSKFPIFRIVNILVHLIRFKPDLIYSTHFFSNLYAAVAGKILGVVSIGSIRNDLIHEIRKNGKWGKLLMRWPTVMVVNSYNAFENAVISGEKKERLFILTNYINLYEFDHNSNEPHQKLEKTGKIKLVLVARLVQAKRIDRFIQLLAKLRKQNKEIVGWIVGSGPEYEYLKTLSRNLELKEDDLLFLGQRDDIPNILKQSDIFILTSDYEGFPNVLLEAMAAKLPVVTTPAGDAEKIIRNGENGFVVPESEKDKFIKKINLLIESELMRGKMGTESRRIVEKQYDVINLDAKLKEILLAMANYSKDRKLIKKVKHLDETTSIRGKNVQAG